MNPKLTFTKLNFETTTSMEKEGVEHGDLR